MTSTSKWVNYDVARNRLLVQIGELDHLIDQEQSTTAPDAAKIEALENEQRALIEQSDMLSADDLDLTSKIASPDWTGQRQ
jgi:hypothetical protein